MELLQVKMLNTAIERILNREMAEIGLTYTQATVIGFLLENEEKEINQRDIEYSLGLSHPTVSSILSRMEANDFICITVSPADRRYRSIKLTDKAKSLSGQIGGRYRKIKGQLFKNVTPYEREIFDQTVQTMLHNTQQ